MMRRVVKVLLFFTVLSAWASQEHIIWNQPSINYPSLISQKKVAKLSQQKDIRTLRIPQTYKGIEIFGYDFMLHLKPPAALITGIKISEIEKDLSSLKPDLSLNDVIKKLPIQDASPQILNNKLVIFIDEHQKAHLAYHVHLIEHAKTLISPYHFIIEANNGNLILSWSDKAHLKIGQGPGGNTISLPYRAGDFQYGDAISGLPSLGKLDIEVHEPFCHMKNKNAMIINLHNKILKYGHFPITVDMEQYQGIEAYRYLCSSATGFINQEDTLNQNSAIAFSPINDALFFTQKTFEMYQIYYGIPKPLGDDLPVRVYTHIGLLDNAFALPTLKSQDKIFSHQQIVIGNGDDYLLAPAQSVIAHELSHNFTALYSNLIYTGQSGAINEAFSDMAAIALQDYMAESYPWYWDKKDWSVGRESVLKGNPLRDMQWPSRDGYSIDNAQDFKEGMNVHHSSGVFNRAFYILAHAPGFSIQKAFQIMIDANMFYWSPISYYDFAACGVMQAAANRHYHVDEVEKAFDEVGVHCPVKIQRP